MSNTQTAKKPSQPANTADGVSDAGIWVYDIETYPNCFLVVFKKLQDDRNGRYASFNERELAALREFVLQKGLTLVGYNNFKFDDVIIKSLLDGAVNNANEIYNLAERLINREVFNDKILYTLTYQTAPWRCIDLFQILGGPRIAGSLKSHEVRLGMPDVQDLPFEPGTDLSPTQLKELIAYCQHDVNATEALFHDVQDLIEVRIRVNDCFRYLRGSALRLSNSGIAEKVMREEVQSRAGIKMHAIRKPERFTFNPNNKIDSVINFDSKHNQALLERLRHHSPFEPSEWLDGLNTGYTFKIASHDIALGRGGVHTIIPAKVIQSENIVEFDVDSYYPSLLRRFGEFPAGITHEWIDVLNELTDARLKAKASGDMSTAGVYKIIINSIYGKLEDKYSINFDPSLQLQVVLNGQLFLIMLMERFHEAGFEVISANTDGVYVDAGDRLDEAIQIADQWSSETGFLLSQRLANMFVATSINDYALYHAEQGWFHKKGQFALGKRTTPMVVTDAALDHFSTGSQPKDYINKNTSILDFLYSSTVGKKNLIEVKHGTDTVQRTNRWYKSINGAPIERWIRDVDDKKVSRRVANSENCAIANRLPSLSIPKDLDHQHYINQAESIINDIRLGKPSATQRSPQLIAKATKLKEKGLVIVPKGYKGYEKSNIPNTYADDVIEYWKNTPLETADWKGYQGFGAYTGRDFNLVAIDIDDPSKATKSGLFEVLGRSGLTAWHGDFERSEIFNGNQRGTVIFQYDGDNLHTTDAKYYFEHGFEILYGKKVVHLAGFHPDGSEYKFSGSLKSIPKKLLNFLEWSLPDKISSCDNKPAIYPTEPISESLQRLEDIVSNDPHISASGFKPHWEASTYGMQLVCLCIGHRSHTNLQGDQNMRVYLSNDKVRTHCFHQSCWTRRRNWDKEINDVYIGNIKAAINPDKLILDGKAKEILEALHKPSKYKLIISPTGSGKTQAIVTLVAQYLDANSGNRDKFAIICSSKDQMIQIANRFAAILETDNINNYGIDLIESTSSLKVGKALSRDSVRDKGKTRVAITHYTYVSRRGFSKYYYAFLKYIDSNTHVLVDEIDAFVESQTRHYPLGSRKRRVASGGLYKNIHTAKCGLFHRFNNCLNCKMHKYDGTRLDINDYRNLDYIPILEYMEGTQPKELEHINYEPRILATVRVNTNEVQMLKQNPSPGPIVFDDDRAADFTTTFEDLLDSSYLPTVHRSVILYNNEEISREDFIEQFHLNQDTKLKDIPEDERAKLRFPSRACNVLTVTTIDRRPLSCFANAKSFSGLTATLLPSQERFISTTINDEVHRFEIDPISDRKMDKIIIIGMPETIPLSAYTNDHLKFTKMFRYRETKKAAEKDFEKLKNSISIRMGYDRRTFMLTSDENEYGNHKILQTYAFSSLGRGVDFAEYDVVNINAAIYKPFSAYVTNEPEALHSQMQDERINIIIQNVGRILRRSNDTNEAIKVIIVENLEEQTDLSRLAEQLSKMSLKPVDTWWIPEFLDSEDFCDYISQTIANGDLPADRPKDYKFLIARAEDLISQGHKKTDIKKALKWATTRKKLSTNEALEVEAAIDQLLEQHKHDPKRDLTAKELQRREKRLQRIHQLRAAGKTDGQIRSAMNVYSGHNPWPEREQSWFEEALK